MLKPIVKPALLAVLALGAALGACSYSKEKTVAATPPTTVVTSDGTAVTTSSSSTTTSTHVGF